MPKTIHTDADRKRYATVIKENGIVSNIHRMESGEPFLDKRQSASFEIVAVSDEVKIGMERQPDGSFDFPIGHVDRPRNPPSEGGLSQ